MVAVVAIVTIAGTAAPAVPLAEPEQEEQLQRVAGCKLGGSGCCRSSRHGHSRSRHRCRIRSRTVGMQRYARAFSAVSRIGSVANFLTHAKSRCAPKTGYHRLKHASLTVSAKARGKERE